MGRHSRILSALFGLAGAACLLLLTYDPAKRPAYGRLSAWQPLAISDPVELGPIPSGPVDPLIFSPSVSGQLRSLTVGDSEQDKDKFLFVGVLCIAKEAERRNLIRSTTLQMAPPGVTVKFVMCRPDLSAALEPELWSENALHKDLWFMQCTENMNEGKSMQYLVGVREAFPGYAYYTKHDMDTYVPYHNLAQGLTALPRCGLYFGMGHKFPDTYMFMTGALYVLSNDLVAEFQKCGKECIQDGFEDMLVADTVRKLAFDRVQPALIAHGTATYEWDRFPLQPNVVSLHPVKDKHLWMQVHESMVNMINATNVRQEARGLVQLNEAFDYSRDCENVKSKVTWPAPVCKDEEDCKEVVKKEPGLVFQQFRRL